MSRVPDYLVEKVHLGEASEAERALVLSDSDAKARLDGLPAANLAFLASLPVDEEVRRIEGRARTMAARAPNRANLVAMLLAPAMAAGLALLLVGIGNDDGREVTTAKGVGAPKLHLYRQRSQGFERLNTGAVARKGDRLQVGVVTDHPEHGVVVSIDGRGEVTLHWPAQPAAQTELRPGEQRMPTAYELDDAPSFERFFLVTTEENPTDVSTVVHAAEALVAAGEAKDGVLAVPSGYGQTSFIVRKEEQTRGGAQ